MSVGKNGNGNGRRFKSYVGVFADGMDFEEWARMAFPGMVIFTVITLSDDCGNDENGSRFTNGQCYEVVLAEPLENGLPEEVIEATRKFWIQCGFEEIRTPGGANLVDVLIRHKVRPIDLAFLTYDEFVHVFSAFVTCKEDLYEGFRRALAS